MHLMPLSAYLLVRLLCVGGQENVHGCLSFKTALLLTFEFNLMVSSTCFWEFVYNILCKRQLQNNYQALT